MKKIILILGVMMVLCGIIGKVVILNSVKNYNTIVTQKSEQKDDFCLIKEESSKLDSVQVEEVKEVSVEPDLSFYEGIGEAEETGLNINHSEFKAMNSDYAGTLAIPCIDLYLPIAQEPTHEEEYKVFQKWLDKNSEASEEEKEKAGEDIYLHHAFEKEGENYIKDKNGSLYFDTDAGFMAQYSAIFGHNMKNLSMFGKLKNIVANPDIINGNDNVFVINDEEVHQYKIVAAYQDSPEEVENDPSYRLNSKGYSLADVSELQDWVESKASEGYWYNRQYNMTDTPVLTLATCAGDAGSGKRTLIQCVMVGRTVM